MTYIEELKAAIADIRKRTKAGKLPLEQRMGEIDAAATKYAVEHAKAYDMAVESGRNPPINYKDAYLLQELADLALYEDLTWSHPDKMSIIEHPIMSDRQEGRRSEKFTKVADIQYGRDTAIGFRAGYYEDDDGAVRRSRTRIYNFPK